MSTVDLTLLGILMNKPLNAYEIKKRMEFMHIRRWTKISSPAVYKNLVNLHRRGYLDAETVREGEMPEKTVYTVNEKGKMHFRSLMEKLSQNPGTVYIEFTTLIAQLNKLEKPEALRMLSELEENLTLTLEGLHAAQKGWEEFPEANAIIGLYADMNELFCNWVRQYRQRFSNS